MAVAWANRHRQRHKPLLERFIETEQRYVDKRRLFNGRQS